MCTDLHHSCELKAGVSRDLELSRLQPRRPQVMAGQLKVDTCPGVHRDNMVVQPPVQRLQQR